MSNADALELRRALSQTGRYLERREPDSRVVHAMAEFCAGRALRNFLAAEIGDPQGIERLAASSLNHQNSFTKYVLADVDEVKLVLHVWRRAEDPDAVETHNHRWNFVSSVLSGGLSAQTLADNPAGDFSFTEYRYHSPGDADEIRLDRVGTTRLSIVSDIDLRAPLIYSQRYIDIHRARVMLDQTVTLVVQGPVLQTTTRVFNRVEVREHTLKREVVRVDPKDAAADVRELLEHLAGNA